VLEDQEEFYSSQELMGLEEVCENPGRCRFRLPLNDERRLVIGGYFEDGAPGRFWYNGILGEFYDLFGEHVELFLGLLAATSARNSVETNVLYAYKAYCRYRVGLPLAAHDKSIPRTEFQGFMVSHYKNIRRILDSVDPQTGRPVGNPLSGPKVSNFYLAMQDLRDSPRAVVIDRWMLQAMMFPARPTTKVTIKLRTGDTLHGLGERVPHRGYEVDLSEPVDWGMYVNEEANNAQARYYGVSFSAGARRVFVPDRAVALNAARRPQVTWGEKSLTDAQYPVVASVVARLADEIRVAPREYQAATWTGIKMEQDPSGIEPFQVYFRQHFGTGLSQRHMEAYATHPRYVLRDSLSQQYFPYYGRER
jgi:hypothetical protein